jgi:hypothetical protein
MAGEPGDFFVRRQSNVALSGIPRFTIFVFTFQRERGSAE